MNIKNKNKWQTIEKKLEYQKNKEMRQRGYGNYLEFETYLKDIKKIIFNIQNEKNQALALNETEDFVISKIEQKADIIEIVVSTYAKVLDLEKKFKHWKNKNYSNSSKTPHYLTDKFKKATIYKIEDFYAALKNYNHNELLEFEIYYNTKLKDNTNIFKQPKARGEIIGSLNRGMFGKTREDLIIELKRKQYKVATDSRFVEYMSDDLLKYRIIALRIAKIYCNKFLERAQNRNSNNVVYLTDDDYEEMRNRTKNLGVIIQELYKNKYKTTPYDEIIENACEGQLTVFELLEESKKKTR